MKLWLALFSALLLGACATYKGQDLKPGEDRLENVLSVMGQPAMRWDNPDGSVLLAYPKGPMGYQTYMASIGTDGKLQQIEKVMNQKSFALIQPGMSKEEVLRILGPSPASYTSYFKTRDELVLEWRYCNLWNEASRFDVLFDNSKATVRKTMSKTESQLGLCGDGACLCSD
ncbi:MAG: hypothetical protein HY016_03255 [Nitrosomonadales bacterium]|nr:hypothetical protein [Nitrosomonadales bacterium]